MTITERCARALAEAANQAYVDQLSPSTKVTWLDLILQSVREPTEEMVDNAWSPYRAGNTVEFDAILRRTIKRYWQAMIDQALKEQP